MSSINSTSTGSVAYTVAVDAGSFCKHHTTEKSGSPCLLKLKKASESLTKSLTPTIEKVFDKKIRKSKKNVKKLNKRLDNSKEIKKLCTRAPTDKRKKIRSLLSKVKTYNNRRGAIEKPDIKDCAKEIIEEIIECEEDEYKIKRTIAETKKIMRSYKKMWQQDNEDALHDVVSSLLKKHSYEKFIGHLRSDEYTEILPSFEKLSSLYKKVLPGDAYKKLKHEHKQLQFQTAEFFRDTELNRIHLVQFPNAIAFAPRNLKYPNIKELPTAEEIKMIFSKDQLQLIQKYLDASHPDIALEDFFEKRD